MLSLETILLRMLLAFVIGGIIGTEREYMNKSAGFRTMILISLGSCMFTLVSIQLSGGTVDRIASNIVTGIGFLGAGVIFKSDNGVSGLTTAATIWITAALGMAVAAGYYVPAIVGCAAVVTVLLTFTRLEKVVDNLHQIHHYRIVCFYEADTLDKYEHLMREHRLNFKRTKQTKVGEEITGSWVVTGPARRHTKFIEQILKDKTVKEFDF